MPIPKPNKGEAKEDFLSRCMVDDVMKTEYKDDKQRAAICMTAFTEKREMKADFLREAGDVLYTGEQIESQFAKDVKENKTYDINDVEIFKEGTWNGAKYTKKDIDALVASFKAIGHKMKPYLKLGHNKEQTLLQKDGLPSAGWITDLKRVGGSLVATFKNIPEKIYKLIKNKAYGRMSAEIFLNLKDTETNKKYSKVLKAVALLGTDTPGVLSLDDFIELYDIDNITYDEIKLLNNYEEASTMEDKELKMLEELKKENEALKASVETIEKQYINAQAKVDELEQSSKEKEVRAYLDKAVKDGKILPSQVNLFTALMINDAEEIKFEYVDDNKKKVINGSTSDIVKEIIENNDQVDFSEKTVHSSVKDKGFVELQEESVFDDIEMDEKIKKYMAENKVTYDIAFDAVAMEVK